MKEQTRKMIPSYMKIFSRAKTFSKSGRVPTENDKLICRISLRNDRCILQIKTDDLI